MVNNEMFDKVYDKLIEVIELKLKYIYKMRRIGGRIDYDTIKVLNLFIGYLTFIKDSKYRYFYVDGLTGISNYLNKM